MVGVEQPEINKDITGKFVLAVSEDEAGDARLSIIIELVPGKEATEELRTKVAQTILRELLRLNTEYAHYVRFILIAGTC
jgi:phenylacetate-CoA ligase